MSGGKTQPGVTGSDPSMEDILASIRRILSEEDVPAGVPPPPPVLRAPEPASDVLILDESMLVEDRPPVVPNFTTGAAGITAGPADDDTLPLPGMRRLPPDEAAKAEPESEQAARDAPVEEPAPFVMDLTALADPADPDPSAEAVFGQRDTAAESSTEEAPIAGQASPRPDDDDDDTVSLPVATASPFAPVPEPVAAEPAEAAAEPEPIAAQSQELVAEPEPIAAKPPEPVAEPEPIAAKPPEPVAEPEPTAAKSPEPVAEPEPIAAKSPEATAEPEPMPAAPPEAAVAPEPVVAEPPPSPRPEPWAAEPPMAPAPEPVTAALPAEPVTAENRPDVTPPLLTASPWQPEARAPIPPLPPIAAPPIAPPVTPPGMTPVTSPVTPPGMTPPGMPFPMGRMPQSPVLIPMPPSTSGPLIRRPVSATIRDPALTIPPRPDPLPPFEAPTFEAPAVEAPVAASEAPPLASQPESSAMSASMSSNAPTGGLASDQTTTAAASSVTNLVRALTSDRAQVHSGGPTIADLVREEIRPLLKEWIDSNLPPLVERLVRAEIERVISRAAI